MKRILTAAVLLPILLLAVWSSEPLYFALLAALAVILGVREFYILAEKVGCRCHRIIGYVAAIVVLVGFYRGATELVVATLLIHYAGELVLWLLTERRFDAVLISTSVAVAGVIYIAFFLGFLILVRTDAGEAAPRLLTLCFALVMAGDTGAYYVGRLIGRHKLAPYVSPGKTVEGSLGGLAASLLAAAVSKATFFPDLPWGHGVGLAVIINVIGQTGDLIESMLKRGSAVKDAAALLPGHGGMLDRLDSIIFNGPIIYLYFRFFYHT
jgi:phosphatidate cytidylyltransferase